MSCSFLGLVNNPIFELANLGAAALVLDILLQHGFCIFYGCAREDFIVIRHLVKECKRRLILLDVAAEFHTCCFVEVVLAWQASATTRPASHTTSGSTASCSSTYNLSFLKVIHSVYFLPFQLTAWWIVVAALVAGVGLLGLAIVVDDGQVLAAHLLRLLVDGELLRELDADGGTEAPL